jgi:ZIP family zinc transporter
MKQYLIALLLSTIAGLSTVIGGFVTFFIKKNSLKFLSFGLGLSAGVMLFVSLVDLYPHASEMVKTHLGQNMLWLVILFFAFVLLFLLIFYGINTLPNCLAMVFLMLM